jgi:holo-[acyl-carrier protein] synthase
VSNAGEAGRASFVIPAQAGIQGNGSYFAKLDSRLRGNDGWRQVAMILGLGSDICDIRRIEAAIARHGDRFLARVFTETERTKAASRTERIQAATYAKRFAAKEAAAKALGTGFRRGVFFSDLGVVNLPSGQPTLLMTGGAAARLTAITPAGMAASVALTMTDEYPYAFAQVIISAVLAH